MLNPHLLSDIGSVALNASKSDHEAVLRMLVGLMGDKHDGLTPKHYARMGEVRSGSPVRASVLFLGRGG